MNVGQQIRTIRRQKHLSLGDIQKRVGLMRTYVSRVENARTIPSLDTLEKLACALRVPMYALFCNGSRPRAATPHWQRAPRWGTSKPEIREFHRLCRMLARIGEPDRRLLLFTAQQMARTASRRFAR